MDPLADWFAARMTEIALDRSNELKADVVVRPPEAWFQSGGVGLQANGNGRDCRIKGFCWPGSALGRTEIC